MYIDKNGRRFNPHAQHVVGAATYDGTVLQFPEVVASLGIQEITDPAPPAEAAAHPDWYFRTEQEEAPYVVWTYRGDEAVANLEQAKKNAAALEYLRSTDWYITRFAETGVAVPAEVLEERAAARERIKGVPWQM